jgi:uncharacterized membrane protein
MTAELQALPSLDRSAIVEAIDSSIAQVNAHLEDLNLHKKHLQASEAQAKVILRGLQSSRAAIDGKAKPSGRAPRSTTGLSPAQELLKVCGPRAYDYAIREARRLQEFGKSDIQPIEGVTLTQLRTAIRVLVVDGALEGTEDGRWRWVREPHLLSVRQQVINHLREHGATTQADLIKALDSTQVRISDTVRKLADEQMVTNVQHGQGKLVELVEAGASNGAS